VTEGYRRAEQSRTRVFPGAFPRWLGQLDLLQRTRLKRSQLLRDLLERDLRQLPLL
jgi:hypothetical protein